MGVSIMSQFDTVQRNPLGEKDYQSINEALTGGANLMHDLQLAAQAGEDTEARMQHCDYYCQRLRAIKATYFPNRP
jgi:hypothetical protein